MLNPVLQLLFAVPMAIGRHHSLIAGCFFLSTLAEPLMAETAVHSDDEQVVSLYEFSLPADELAKTLIEFAVQSHSAVVVPYDLVTGYRSSPVIGTMPKHRALGILLRRTPFTFHISQTLPEKISIARKPDETHAPRLADEPQVKEATNRLHEEVIVTGIRYSLMKSLEIKRNASGVVDAITAADIGAFPDANLAEAIQRIPGASISRDNGEGSRVTVRGFTGNYNLITYNGRTMPVISAPVDRVEDSRAFEFSHLAAANVSRVEVHKTYDAARPLGGIGAIIDIQSYRPLDIGGNQNYVSVKALRDTSQRAGSSVTPELAGLMSWSDGDAWGVLVAASFQERHSSSAQAYVSQWQTRPWAGGDEQALAKHANACDETGGDPLIDQCYRLENTPEPGQLYSVADDLHYASVDSRRKRFNAQATLQFRPQENITATLDYALFRNTLKETASEMLLRLTGNRSYLHFDNRSVKTPVISTETFFDDQGLATSSDLGFASQLREQENLSDSLGFKLEYSNQRNFTLRLDAHRSASVSGPGDASYGSWANLRFGANVVGAQQVDWRGELPQASITVSDDLLAAQNSNDGRFDARDVGTQVAFTNYSHQQSEIQQFRLDGRWDGAASSLEFGLDQSNQKNTTQFSDAFFIMGDWGISDPSLVPDTFFAEQNFADLYDGYNTSRLYDQGFTANVATLVNWAEEVYSQSFDGGFRYNQDLAINRSVGEDTSAVYLSISRSGEFFSRPFTVRAGSRYSMTKVTAAASASVPRYIAWYDNGDFDPVYLGDRKQEVVSHRYSNFLPSVQLELLPADQWVMRFAYSQSLARAEYAELSPEVSSLNVSGVTSPGQSNAYAESGNPRLEPLKSDNIDVSLEWYGSESSYLSIGYYEKNINNFIGTQTLLQPVYNLRDASAGARAIAAREAISSSSDFDGNITETELFNQIAATENNDFNPPDSDNTYYGNAYDILPQAEDPVFQFAVLAPDNNKKVRIWGVEYAAQYFLGDSGLGVFANYTSVNGDIGFDINEAPSATQFALLGLSDSMNVVGIYEKHGIRARIAYNWRANYLSDLAEEPTFVEAHHQVDFMAGYDITPNLSVQLEGVNITGEDSRSHGRTAVQLNRLVLLNARYYLGLHYSFD